MINPFDFMNTMGMLQDKLRSLQDDVTKTTATGEAGAGMVKITVNGLGTILDVKIDPALMSVDNTHTLEVLIASASNAATTNVQEILKQKNGELLAKLERA